MLENLDESLAATGRLSGQQVVQYASQTEDVGPGVDALALAAGLLGGHVAGRAADLLKSLARDRDRQTEVDQPRQTVVAQDDVLRLDVAVQKPAGVDLGQPLRDLLDQPGTAPEVSPFVRRQLVERPAGDVFDDQVDLVTPALHPVARRDERAADPRQGAALVEHRLAPAG